MTLPLHAQRYQLGTVTRMEMRDCTLMHGALITMLGDTPQPGASVCSEYTLVSDKVVYVVDGKRSGQLIPLAEGVQFRLHKKELLVRIDDEKNESRFSIKEMILRADWEHDQVLRKKEAELRIEQERNGLRKRDDPNYLTNAR
jgi:hypothetical protein